MRVSLDNDKSRLVMDAVMSLGPRRRLNAMTTYYCPVTVTGTLKEVCSAGQRKASPQRVREAETSALPMPTA